jgi:hypothetical protein
MKYLPWRVRERGEGRTKPQRNLKETSRNLEV